MTRPRPHDLVRLSPGAATRLPAAAPAWARCALQACPWVVVRRAYAPDELLAVGIRGTARSHRYGWTITTADILETVTPEDLADLDPVSGRKISALRTLRPVRDAMSGGGMAWGPTGSVGYELATGTPTATADSDLDVLIRAHDLSTSVLTCLALVQGRFGGLEARVDCQVETRMGAVALADLLSSSDVMVKTPWGPRLLERRHALS